MNQECFMRELREALDGRLSEPEIAEILADYREFFEAGLAEAEGGAEEQVAQRLGDPAKIALSLLRKEAPVQESLCVEKAPIYKRVISLSIDALVPTLPFIWLAPRLAISSFFWPQWIASFLPSLLSTIQVSSHWWIAAARPFWVAALFCSGVWFVMVNPVCLWFFKGRTLGKWLLGVRVVDRSGSVASPAQVMAREVFGKTALNALLSFLWLPLGVVPSLVSLVWSAVSPEGMTLWDAMAGTRVVESKTWHKEG